MLARVVARLVNVSGSVHASSQAYDHAGASSLGQGSIRFAAVDCFGAAEDTAVDSDEVSKVPVHGWNYPVFP
jgi:hypothetical protein